MSYLTIFFDQMSFLAKYRIDQKSYATNCRIGEMVFDELSRTVPVDVIRDRYLDRHNLLGLDARIPVL